MALIALGVDDQSRLRLIAYAVVAGLVPAIHARVSQ
jgi:hypothetical protein